MFKVKITQPGWEAFHGDFAGYLFQDGVSVDPLPRNICDRISALVTTELLDLNDEELGQGGAAARIIARRELEGLVLPALAVQTDEEKDAETKAAFDEAGAGSREFYNKDQLEAIASTEGIAGIRKVAKPWNVKDRSIPALIKAILKAQADYEAVLEAKKEEERRARAAAGDAAMAEQLRLEQEAFAASRVLSQDTTPNAVGENGEPIHVEQTTPPANEFEPAANVDESQKVTPAGEQGGEA